MDTAHAQPDRQAWRELLPLLWGPGIFGAVGLFFAVNLSLGLPLPQDQHGRLPWPIVQWALTTPAGALVSMVAGAAVLALIFLPGEILWMRMAFRDRLAHAIDMTGVPREVWPTHPVQHRPADTRRERWLGHGRRAQRTNLAVLILAVLLALVLLLGVIEAFAFESTALYRVAFIHICELHGCPPSYPAGLFMAGSVFLVIPFIQILGLGWLPYIEVRCGIGQLHYLSVRPAQMGYIRRPGVTPEAAAAALVRFIPRNAAPRARIIATLVFVSTPLVLWISVAFFLNGWLQLQWIPG